MLDAGDGDRGLAVGNRRQGAGVAALSAHLGVEGGLVGDDEKRIVLRVDFEDARLAFIRIEAGEFGDRIGRDLECAHDG